MGVLRARLSWLVCFWLLAQATSLAVAPFALCCHVAMPSARASADGTAGSADDGASATADADCPLHAAAQSSASAESGTPAADAAPGTCVMRGTCTPSVVALASLLGSAAILPDLVTAAVDASSVTVRVAAESTPASSSFRVNPPPK